MKQQPVAAKSCNTSASWARPRARGAGGAAPPTMAMTDDFAEMNAKILSIYAAHQERDVHRDSEVDAEGHGHTCTSAAGAERLTAEGTIADSEVWSGDEEEQEVDEEEGADKVKIKAPRQGDMPS